MGVGTIKSRIQMPDGSIPGGLRASDRNAAAMEIALTNAMASGGFLFKKAVVVEVINDVYQLETLMEEEGPYATNIINRQVAACAPRNSILMKAHEDDNETEIVCALPFFASHIILPIKVGETVWYLDGPEYPYWFSRVSSTDQIEDVNYTHTDRELITSVPLGEDAKQKMEKANGTSSKYVPENNFGIGGETDPALGTVPQNFSPENIKNNRQLYDNIREVIPRWTPRVGDLVLQGSNNTLISLGTDRGWSKTDEEIEFSNGTDDPAPMTGTIDIVVGRGALEEDPGPTTASALGDDPERTKPRVLETAEGDLETDKIFRHNDQDPPRAEGDPDFHTDLSRIYVTMASEIDAKLALTEEYYEPIAGEITDMAGPSIALKSNEIRIVSREDGSVRILKEKGEGEGSSIVMMPDGSIHITGDKIYIGQPGGEGPGENGSEPYVKYSQLKDWCDKLHQELDSFCQTLMTHVTPGYGSPSPQITQAATTMKANLVNVKMTIDKFPSERIYGE